METGDDMAPEPAWAGPGSPELLARAQAAWAAELARHQGKKVRGGLPGPPDACRAGTHINPSSHLSHGSLRKKVSGCHTRFHPTRIASSGVAA